MTTESPPPRLPVIQLPEDTRNVLRQTARPVARVDRDLARFMESMLETMYSEKGIGLAANQVGRLDRVITVDISEARDGRAALLMANPTIVWRSEETFTWDEGCLCLPGQYASVTRPKRIRLTYLNQSGKLCELEAEDLLSQCLQHEIDHLDGTLFIDHLSKLKRDMLVRKATRALREK